jgi:hypothetical protein
MDEAEPEEVRVPQPKWWDELPLVPFMHICSYLNYKQVFGRLTRVCKHFNQLLSENEVKFYKLRLCDPSPRKIYKLMDRISGCNSLHLILGRQLVGMYMSDRIEALGELLEKFKKSVVKVKVMEKEDSSFDRIAITSFLNGCERLQFLDISSADDWDWSSHTVCPTVQMLIYRVRDRDIADEDPNTVTKIFYVFPGLKSLRFLDVNDGREGYAVDSKEDEFIFVSGPEKLAMIEHYVASNLAPPVQCFWAVKHVRLSCHYFETLEKLVRYINDYGSFRALQTFTLRLHSVEPFDSGPEAENGVGQCLERLIEALPNTLVELNIFADPNGNYSAGNDYDLRIMKLLGDLPATVQSIEYFGFTIRDS